MISCLLFFVDNNGVDSKTWGHLLHKKRNWSLTSLFQALILNGREDENENATTKIRRARSGEIEGGGVEGGSLHSAQPYTVFALIFSFAFPTNWTPGRG